MDSEQKTKKNVLNKPITQSILGSAVVFLLLGAFLFWQANHGTVFIENAEIDAPIISLSGTTGGTLNALYVKEGDVLTANTPVALIGTDTVTAKQSGVVIQVANTIGTFFAPGQSVVSMIHPEDLRVVGTVDENKGLEKIKSGQRVSFTVDTFGSKKYIGVVESVAETANDTGVVFSISDKRPIKKFDVKVRFAVADYPELKDGMSAKITVYVE